MIDDGIDSSVLWALLGTRMSPYSDHVYANPTFYEWHEWFAWHPVKMIYMYRGDEDGFGQGMKTYRWVWLQKIVRRKVIDDFSRPGTEGSWPTKRKNYEYTTLMDLLKNGH